MARRTTGIKINAWIDREKGAKGDDQVARSRVRGHSRDFFGVSQDPTTLSFVKKVFWGLNKFAPGRSLSRYHF
jgi:hypothetical protein